MVKLEKRTRSSQSGTVSCYDSTCRSVSGNYCLPNCDANNTYIFQNIRSGYLNKAKADCGGNY